MRAYLSTPVLLAFLLALTAARLSAADQAPPPTDAPEATPAEEAAPDEPEPVRNRNLEFARELLEKKRHPQALRELETALRLPGNPPEIVVDIHLTRAEALLTQKKADEAGACAALVEAFRLDQEVKVPPGAPEAMHRLLSDVRVKQAVILHAVPEASRADRPVRLRVRLLDPQQEVEGVSLHFRALHLDAYTREPLRRDATAFSGFIRDPLLAAPPEKSDDFVIPYFLTAEDAAGKVLDSYGTAREPLRLDISTARAEARLQAMELDTVRELRTGPLPPPEPPQVKARPWYLKWYTLGAAGTVVAAAVGGTVWALSRPEPLNDNLGQIHLPVRP